MAITSSVSTLLREENPAEGGMFSIRVDVENPDVLRLWLEMGDKFEQETEKAFTKCVFEVHKYLMRVTPIDTGELRGGWTAWLDANNQNYTEQLLDTSIAEKAPGRGYHITPDAVQIGKKYSSFLAPSPLDITIQNDVPYGFYLEAGTSRIPARNFLELARYKAEFIFGQFFETWFSEIARAEDITESPEPDKIAL